jgi:hypothetical protein
MMKRLLVLAAGGVGYVLGARAGRERYEQIRSAANRVRHDPRVQEKAGHAADLAREKGPVVKDKVAGAASGAAATASDKVGSGSSSGTDDLEEKLHPDSTARQDDPYPKGDLP